MRLPIRNSLVFFLFFMLLFSFLSRASEKKDSGEFNLVEFAMHHISDANTWVFYENKNHEPVGIQLPRILWNKETGRLNFYLNTEKAIGAGYSEEIEFNKQASEGKLIIPGAAGKFEELQKKIESEKNPGVKKILLAEQKKLKPLDFSITKNVLFLLMTAILLLWIFLSIAKKYKKNPVSAPKGIQSAFEPIIVFIRDDIARTYIPHHYERYLPLLLNLFFFIWFLNMIGLIPFSANVSGNFAFTATLALITAVVTNFSAGKRYWGHIFWFPGVPVFVKPIMFVVELVSVFTKPFALAIRLFANITAGHLVVLSFICLIFIFGKLGQVPALGYGTSVISIIFTLFIDCIELLIALLQAYIFTTLSALFIGQAVETEH